mmetsp:Transcript_24890/g.36708  ORF Transcript_24890/g.36708 Transcript_24890/m.36708 type:complete len:553 (+) Transcript_24890:167-1825(+)
MKFLRLIARSNHRNLFISNVENGKAVYGVGIIRKLHTSDMQQVHRWKSLRVNTLSDLASRKDAIGLLSELKNISTELFKSNSVIDADLAIIAANICVGDNGVNYKLGCDIFDALNVHHPSLTETGYKKLLDLCILRNQASIVTNIHLRMRAQGVALAPGAYERLIAFLSGKGRVAEAAELVMLMPTASTRPLVTLAEPLLMTGQHDRYLQLFRRCVSSSPCVKPADVLKILVAVVWAQGRVPAQSSLEENTRFIRELLHSVDEYAVRLSKESVDFDVDFQAAKEAVSLVLLSDGLDYKTRSALARLRWKFMSSKEFVPFPYLAEETFEASQVVDLTSEMQKHPTSASGIMFSKSFWPRQYSSELRGLVGGESLDDDQEDDLDDDDSDSEFDEELGSGIPSNLQSLVDDDDDDDEVMSDFSMLVSDDDDMNGLDSDSDEESEDEDDEDEDDDDDEFLDVPSQETLKALEKMHMLGCDYPGAGIAGGLNCNDLTAQFANADNSEYASLPLRFAGNIFGGYNDSYVSGFDGSYEAIECMEKQSQLELHHNEENDI